MKLFETDPAKKSIIITISSFVLLFLLFFFLKFSDSLPLPELEGGGGGGEIAVNFGDSDFGSGANFDSKEIVTAAPEEVVETPTEEKEILISENEEAPAIAEVKTPDTKIEKKIEEKPVVKPTPKPSRIPSYAENAPTPKPPCADKYRPGCCWPTCAIEWCRHDAPRGCGSCRGREPRGCRRARALQSRPRSPFAARQHRIRRRFLSAVAANPIQMRRGSLRSV